MTDLAEATRTSEAIFVAVGTPQSESGDADLSYVDAVACDIARSLISYKVIVEKSTVPVYTNEWIRRAIERNGVARKLFDVVSNPESWHRLRWFLLPKGRRRLPFCRENLGIDFNLLTEVEKINGQQKRRFLSKVRSSLWTLRGKRLGVLGLAFKGETDDIRESPAIEIVQMLLVEGCSLVAYDPAAMVRAAELLPECPNLRYATDSLAAATDADALVILTDWAEFGALDLKRLNKALRYPIVIDGRNLFDPHVMSEHGFTYLSIGRPEAYPVRDLDHSVFISSADLPDISALGALSPPELISR
jgi:UDP-glucose 6-dehydrogenase